MNRLSRGLLAGAAGTLALDVATYADMALRGRPSSTVPAKVAERAFQSAGLVPEEDTTPPRWCHRFQGVGALFGYGTGLGVGMVYALAPRSRRRVHTLLPGLVVGLLTMAATDAVSTMAGATDPGTWDLASWMSDAVPHAIYGVTVVLVCRPLVNRSS